MYKLEIIFDIWLELIWSAYLFGCLSVGNAKSLSYTSCVYFCLDIICGCIPIVIQNNPQDQPYFYVGSCDCCRCSQGEALTTLQSACECISPTRTRTCWRCSHIIALERNRIASSWINNTLSTNQQKWRVTSCTLSFSNPRALVRLAVSRAEYGVCGNKSQGENNEEGSKVRHWRDKLLFIY